MKGKFLKRRVLAFVLALSVLLSTCSINVTVAEAKAKSTISVKPTGKRLLEGFALTKGMIRKTVKVTENGKPIKYSLPKKQLNTTITPSKNGKKKLRVKAYGRVLAASVKVNYMTNLYVRKINNFVLTEDDKFSEKIFRKNIIIMAEYQYGKDKKFTNYQIKAPKVVKSDKNGYCTVKVFCPAKNGTTKNNTTKNNTFECTVRIRVVKKQTDTTATPSSVPTQEPPKETAQPSTVPTQEPPKETAQPSTVPTQEPPKETTQPSAVPTQEPPKETAKPSTVPTQEPPKETTQPSTVPTQEPPKETAKPSATPTQEPSEEPDIFSNLTIVRNGEGNVTVNNNLCTFSDNSTTEKVTKGECTLTFHNTNQWKYERVVDKETGTTLSTDLSYSFNISSNRTFVVVFERVYTVTVHRIGGRGKVIFNGEDLEFFNDTATCTVPAGLYDSEALPTDDYDVVCYRDKNGKEFSTLPEQKISVVDDTEFTVEFRDATKTVLVSYYRDNTQLILSEAVAFGEALAPPTKDLGWANHTLIGWLLGDTLYEGSTTDSEFYSSDGQSLSDAIKTRTLQKQNVELVAQYRVDSTPYYPVTIDGGTITSFNGEVNEENEYKDGSRLYFEPNIPDGKFFDHWEINGDIVSYKEIADCYVHAPLSLKAVFSDVEVEKKPVVLFTSPNELFSDDRIVRLHMAADIPEGYEKIEFGFLYTFEDLSEEDMILGGVAKTVTTNEEFSASGHADWTYDMRLTNENRWINQDTLLVRVYLKVTSIEGSETVYSSIVNSTQLKL